MRAHSPSVSHHRPDGLGGAVDVEARLAERAAPVVARVRPRHERDERDAHRQAHHVRDRLESREADDARQHVEDDDDREEDRRRARRREHVLAVVVPGERVGHDAQLLGEPLLVLPAELAAAHLARGAEVLEGELLAARRLALEQLRPHVRLVSPHHLQAGTGTRSGTGRCVGRGAQ